MRDRCRNGDKHHDGTPFFVRRHIKTMEALHKEITKVAVYLFFFSYDVIYYDVIYYIMSLGNMPSLRSYPQTIRSKVQQSEFTGGTC